METINVGNDSYLVVEVKNNAHQFELDDCNLIYYEDKLDLDIPHNFILPESIYEIILATKTSTEEQAKLIFEDNGLNEYPDFIRNGLCLLPSALQSLNSLLKSHKLDPSLNWLFLKIIK